MPTRTELAVAAAISAIEAVGRMTPAQVRDTANLSLRVETDSTRSIGATINRTVSASQMTFEALSERWDLLDQSIVDHFVSLLERGYEVEEPDDEGEESEQEMSEAEEEPEVEDGALQYRVAREFVQTAIGEVAVGRGYQRCLSCGITMEGMFRDRGNSTMCPSCTQFRSTARNLNVERFGQELRASLRASMEIQDTLVEPPPDEAVQSREPVKTPKKRTKPAPPPKPSVWDRLNQDDD